MLDGSGMTPPGGENGVPVSDEFETN